MHASERAWHVGGIAAMPKEFEDTFSGNAMLQMTARRSMLINLMAVFQVALMAGPDARAGTTALEVPS